MSAPVEASEGVWSQVIGQQAVVEELRAAVSDPSAMTHAWLFTGPPGSGRSVAARAFAAAVRSRVAELLSGLPLQTLAQATPPSANGRPGPSGRRDAHATHHPHAQTGATPQLHP